MSAYSTKAALRNWSEWRDLNPRQSAPKADGLPGCPTLGFEIEIVEILEIRWDVLESNQPSHPVSWGRITRCLHPLYRRSHCASPHDLTHVWAFCAKLKRSFSRAIYHILGTNWSITPNDVLSFNMKCGVSFHGCSRPIAGHLWVFCPIRASYTIEQFRLAFDSKIEIEQVAGSEGHAYHKRELHPDPHCSPIFQLGLSVMPH